MMEDFNIDNLKKEMPYKVPENFFETITEKTLSEAKKKRRFLYFSQWKTVSISVAASLLLFFGVKTFFMGGNSSENSNYIAFEETLQRLFSNYSTEILESVYEIEDNTTTNTYNEIDQILSEIPDSELEDIFSDTGSDIFYAKL